MMRRLKTVSLLMVASAVAAPSACRRRTPPPATLAAVVESAKREGRTSAGFTQAIEPIDDGLPDLLRVYPLAVISPVRVVAVTHDTGLVDANRIITWSLFRVVEEWTARRTTAAAPCTLAPPPGPSPAPNEIVLALLGGTTVVDGVSVHQAMSTRFDYEGGRRYVAFLSRCSDGAAALPMDGYDVFEVKPNGDLSPGRFGPALTYQKQILNFRTLDRLREYVDSAARNEPK